MRQQRMEVLKKFDQDKDGILNAEERAEARKYVKENQPARGFGGPGGPPGGGPGGDLASVLRAAVRVSGLLGSVGSGLWRPRLWWPGLWRPGRERSAGTTLG